MFHIFLHFLIPLGIALVFFRTHFKLAVTIMIATMIVDVDHLLATPVYDPNRCSIGFHPLHQLWFIGLYLVMCFVPKLRLIGIGLVIHMLLDGIDCYVNTGSWIYPS